VDSSDDFGNVYGIVFSRLYAVRLALRGAMSRWVAMRDAARECQARCINRSDTFDFSFLRSRYSGARAITDPPWSRLQASCHGTGYRWWKIPNVIETEKGAARWSQPGCDSEEAAKWRINSAACPWVMLFTANAFHVHQ